MDQRKVLNITEKLIPDIREEHVHNVAVYPVHTDCVMLADLLY